MYYTADTNSNTGFVTATSKFGKVNLTQNNPDGSDVRLVKNGNGYNIVLGVNPAGAGAGTKQQTVTVKVIVIN